MSYTMQFNALVARHRSIEARLESELKRPMPDSLVLQRLKRQKLAVRDKIEAWPHVLRPSAATLQTALGVRH
ncbi:MAG: YdcH family protein [Pseudomonadota bacterium]